MDRFIECTHQKLQLNHFYLKSNMDRFIVPQGVDYEQNILHLKSNMDRFIVTKLYKTPYIEEI